MPYFLKQKCVERYSPVHEYTFTGKCTRSERKVSVTLNGEDLFRYNQGAFIQEAFPYISPEKRDWMMSGILTDFF